MSLFMVLMFYINLIRKPFTSKKKKPKLSRNAFINSPIAQLSPLAVRTDQFW